MSSPRTKNLARVALDFKAFEDGVVGVHVLGRCPYRILCVGIPDHNIRIGTVTIPPSWDTFQKIFAGASAVTSTNRSNDIRPSFTPW